MIPFQYQREWNYATYAACTHFFLTVSLDQVSFMEGLMQPDQLRARILPWTEEEIRLDRLPANKPAPAHTGQVSGVENHLKESAFRQDIERQCI